MMCLHCGLILRFTYPLEPVGWARSRRIPNHRHWISLKSCGHNEQYQSDMSTTGARQAGIGRSAPLRVSLELLQHAILLGVPLGPLADLPDARSMVREGMEVCLRREAQGLHED